MVSTVRNRISERDGPQIFEEFGRDETHLVHIPTAIDLIPILCRAELLKNLENLLLHSNRFVSIRVIVICRVRRISDHTAIKKAAVEWAMKQTLRNEETDSLETTYFSEPNVPLEAASFRGRETKSTASGAGNPRSHCLHQERSMPFAAV